MLCGGQVEDAFVQDVNEPRSLEEFEEPFRLSPIELCGAVHAGFQAVGGVRDVGRVLSARYWRSPRAWRKEWAVLACRGSACSGCVSLGFSGKGVSLELQWES